MRIVLILLAFVSLVFSCNKSRNQCVEADLDCSTIRCIAHWDNFDFRLIDKATGTDLVFGANPKYAANDIRLYYDVGRTVPIQFQLDNNSKTIKVMTAKQEMYLEIKGTDVYKLTTEFRTETCCSSRVKTLWQDGQMVCSCCPDAISLSIR
ncbi:MAG TPA: hypothetical protein VIS75_03440 [Chitinophagaceae bacterium]